VLSVVALMEGEAAHAYGEAMAAVESELEGSNTTMGVWWAGRAALALGDAAKARVPLDRTPPGEESWVVATRRAIEAGIAALEGHPGEAASAYSGILDERIAKGDRFTHALVTIDAGAVLLPDRVPEGAVDTARAFLQEIGAAALLAQLLKTDVPALTDR
jgi:hypothetical protein